jgi:hypothetical protein
LVYQVELAFTPMYHPLTFTPLFLTPSKAILMCLNLDECGVKDGVITFEQFYDLVALVNQVELALDNDEEELLGDGSEADLLLEEEVKEGDKGHEEAYKWLVDAVNLGQEMKKDVTI